MQLGEGRREVVERTVEQQTLDVEVGESGWKVIHRFIPFKARCFENKERRREVVECAFQNHKYIQVQER